MFRLVVLGALVAGSSATFGPGFGVGVPLFGAWDELGAYGLARVLASGDIGPALEVVRRRYRGISVPAAAQIILLSLSRPPRLVLPGIKYRTVPAPSGRLGYVRSLFDALPPVFYNGGYSAGLLKYLHNRQLRLSAGALVDPLAMTDYYIGSSRLAPVSVPAFNNFFGDRVLGLNSGFNYGGFYMLPPPPVVASRLGSLALDKLGHLFRPISGGPAYGGPAFGGPGQPGGGDVVRGAGKELVPLFSDPGLPSMVHPGISLPGFADYLQSAHVPVGRFVQRVKVIKTPTITTLMRPIQIPPIVRQLSLVSAPVVRRDILPLMAYRYQTLPAVLRANINFATVVPRYLSTYKIGGGQVFNRGFVRGLMGGFDGYLHSILKGYQGSLWRRGLSDH